MLKRTKEQYAGIVERQNRENITKKFKNAQEGSQDLRKYINSNWSPKVRGVCDRIIDIVQRLTQPRPEPGNRRKRELDEQKLEPMVKQLQQQIHELSEVERSNIAAFGATLPGSIRNVVQGFVGNSIAISYDPRGPVDQTLVTGPHNMDSSLGIEQNAEKRSLQEGGVSAEVEEADQEEGLVSNPGPSHNPLKMELTPN